MDTTVARRKISVNQFVQNELQKFQRDYLKQRKDRMNPVPTVSH